MLDISTLYVYLSAFFEAFLGISVPRKAAEKAVTLTKNVLMSNIACEIHLIVCIVIGLMLQ